MPTLPHHHTISGFFVFASALVLLGGTAPLMVSGAPASALTLAAGDRVRCGKLNTIYLIDSEYKRHAFPDRVTYRSWFSNERGVKQVKQKICNDYPVGANVTIRPGSSIVGFSGEKKIYAVSDAGLRHIGDIKMLRFLYPSKNKNRPDKIWQAAVRTLPAARKNDYVIANPVRWVEEGGGALSYIPEAELEANKNILALFPKALAAPGQASSAEQARTSPRTPETTGSANPSPAVSPATSSPSPSQPVTPSPTVVASPTPTATPTPSATPQAVTAPTGATAGVGIADASKIITRSTFAQPAFNQPVTYPIFGTSIRRITDRVRTGANGFATHDYSQLQAFSRDSQYVLLGEDGASVVRRVDTLARAKDSGLENTNAIRWQPALSHTLVHYDTNEDDRIRAQYTNVDTGVTETVFTFPANYARIRGNQSFDELSQDGKWMAGLATLANGGRMIFSLNLQTKILGAQVSLEGLFSGGGCARDPEYGVLEPDWIGVSPLGKYVVVQWVRDGVTRCSGLETWDIQTGKYVGHLIDHHSHGDLGVDKDGTREYFMTFDNGSAGSDLPVQGVHYLPGPATGLSPTVYLQTMNWGTQHHISCQGPNGVCVVTAYLHNPDAPNEPWHPFDEEIFLQYSDGRVLRLGHHRSSQCGYWVQPRASISHDGRYVIFDSDWGVNRCAASNDDLGRGEVYLFELPAGLAAAGPAGTTVSSPTQTPSPSSSPIQSATPTASATATPAAGSGQPVLGSVGPLPASTYILKNLETFDFNNGQERDIVYTDPRMGEGTCFATDFIQYDVYASKDGSPQYTYLGGHTGTEAGQWVTGNSADTGGCAKDRVVYTLHPGRGTYLIGLCITNVKKPSERICKTLSMTQ